MKSCEPANTAKGCRCVVGGVSSSPGVAPVPHQVAGRKACGRGFALGDSY